LERRILRVIDSIYALVARLEALAIALEIAFGSEGRVFALYASRVAACDALVPMDVFLENALKLLGFETTRRELDGYDDGLGISVSIVEMKRGSKRVSILFKCRTLNTCTLDVEWKTAPHQNN